MKETLDPTFNMALTAVEHGYLDVSFATDTNEFQDEVSTVFPFIGPLCESARQMLSGSCDDTIRVLIGGAELDIRLYRRVGSKVSRLEISTWPGHQRSSLVEPNVVFSATTYALPMARAIQRAVLSFRNNTAPHEMEQFHEEFPLSAFEQLENDVATRERSLKKQSKTLSLLLRHAPHKAGLTLDNQGWVTIEDLLAGLKTMRRPMTLAQLQHVVETNEKKRFRISDDGLKIRASQGHSINVDLALDPIEPPETVYHGTTGKSLPAIRQKGLLPMTRQHVHLSPDKDTATKVGARHGKPLILEVSSLDMHRAGYEFFRSDNGVWLTQRVPTEYIQFPNTFAESTS